MLGPVKYCGCGHEWNLDDIYIEWRMQGRREMRIEADGDEPEVWLLMWECTCQSTLVLEVRI